ncbi:MAG: tRNA lysidine(34) synthetase TilS [Candidatus Omnitrophota bacterium]|nr:MAG: tRNA lysidine(34) synthetase TilS [Candidatus Omnitrophota bacterium]
MFYGAYLFLTPMNKLINTIKLKIEEQQTIVQEDRILVCVSGGPDSVFLLHFLMQIKEAYNLKLFVAHINHLLRGKHALKDAEFTRSLSEKYQLRFITGKAETTKFAIENKLSLEDAARRLRREFFLKTALRYRINKIALAHTKDDQVETILMRILRGTGIKGLCAMQPVSKLGPKLLIRPLLCIKKQEIIEYLKENNFKARLDASNLKTDFFRNKVRLQIIPFLKKFSLKFEDNLCRLSLQAIDLNEFLDYSVDNIFADLVVEQNKNKVKIKRDAFLSLKPALSNQLIRKIILDLKYNLKNIDFKHIQIIKKFSRQYANQTKTIQLPQGIFVRNHQQFIYFFKRLPIAKVKNNLIVKKINFNQESDTVVLNYSFSISSFESNLKVKLKKHSAYLEYFDLDKIKMPLLIRGKKLGDIFRPLGLKGSKKLKKFFIDQKISIDLRDSVPLVISGKEIIWVVGLRISEDYKVTLKTKRILKVQAKKMAKA